MTKLISRVKHININSNLFLFNGSKYNSSLLSKNTSKTRLFTIDTTHKDKLYLDNLNNNNNNNINLNNIDDLIYIEVEYEDITAFLNSSVILPNDERLILLDKLPNNITHIDCGGNKLTSLNNLPDSIIELYCWGNDIISFQKFPSSIIKLTCDSNKLSSLDNLPNSITYLNCCNNNLTSLNIFQRKF